jgi:hypothetical protein
LETGELSKLSFERPLLIDDFGGQNGLNLISEGDQFVERH